MVPRADECAILRDRALLKGCAHVRAFAVHGVELTPDVTEKNRASAHLYDTSATIWEFFLRKDLDPVHLALLSGCSRFYGWSGLRAAQDRPVPGCL